MASPSRATHMTRPPVIIWRMALLFSAAAIGLGLTARDAEAQDEPPDLVSLSLEQLMNVEVTSVSKRQQRLFEAAAAIHVITNEDLRRSGATSIAEAFRMVPGMQVARLTSNVWAVSARGFNAEYANKLLVLVDGRSVYSPLFAGVNWDVQDLLLEDVDRIEVIRGPGATMWGANAVNGVINVVTKSAKDTQGGFAQLIGGSERLGTSAARYGARLGSTGWIRVFGKYFKRDGFSDLSGQPGTDDWDVGRGGLQLEFDASRRDQVRVQSQFYGGQTGGTILLPVLAPPYGEAFTEDNNVNGGHALVRWSRTPSEHTQLTFQAYYDIASRDLGRQRDRSEALDLDIQHAARLGSVHDLVWGVAFRASRQRLTGDFPAAMIPETRSDQLFSGFLQDEIGLFDRRILLTVGSKFEHNDYSGFEIQPTFRALWAPSDHHAVWGAVSRAVRTPSRAEHDLEFTRAVLPGENGVANRIDIFGTRNFASEEMWAYEVGYRAQPTPRVSIDVAAFRNEYGRFISIESVAPFPDTLMGIPFIVRPVTFGNRSRGNTMGIETSVRWTVTDRWRLAASYTGFDMELRYPPGSPVLAGDIAGDNPRHQVHVRSYLDLPGNSELDAAVYHVGRLENQPVPGYTRVDLRAGWRPFYSVQLTAGVQNLLDRRHAESATLNSASSPRKSSDAFTAA